MKPRTRRELLKMLCPKPEVHRSIDEEEWKCAQGTRSLDMKPRCSEKRALAEGIVSLIGVKVAGSQCTGCGLCTLDCPTGALSICHDVKGGCYQLTFEHGVCSACGVCEKSCPEHCLHLERNLEGDRATEASAVIFQDRVSPCRECGIPLFPQAMIDHLRAKLSATGETPWQFDCCPSCRMKALLGQESLARRDVNVQGNTSWEPSSGR